MVVAPENPLTGEPAATGLVPGSVAVAACAAMALFYVAILYSPTLILRLPPPSSLDSFMIRRFACAIVSSAISVVASAILLGLGRLEDLPSVLGVFGIRKDHLAPFTEELVFRACMIPLLLCGGFKTYSIIFLSPVFFSLGNLFIKKNLTYLSFKFRLFCVEKSEFLMKHRYSSLCNKLSHLLQKCFTVYVLVNQTYGTQIFFRNMA